MAANRIKIRIPSDTTIDPVFLNEIEEDFEIVFGESIAERIENCSFLTFPQIVSFCIEVTVAGLMYDSLKKLFLKILLRTKRDSAPNIVVHYSNNHLICHDKSKRPDFWIEIENIHIRISNGKISCRDCPWYMDEIKDIDNLINILKKYHSTISPLVRNRRFGQGINGERYLIDFNKKNEILYNKPILHDLDYATEECKIEEILSTSNFIPFTSLGEAELYAPIYCEHCKQNIHKTLKIQRQKEIMLGLKNRIPDRLERLRTYWDSLRLVEESFQKNSWYLFREVSRQSKKVCVRECKARKISKL